ncbi:MFS transporter [Streptomyces rapamycinicus]|uniref:Major facilitator superfamily (MFS) profile domain-containing protein n=2 Tax=Streptomyces rapamycinicus TaxID=1226757 RepID=A0A0A0NWR8_STRRN|nr:MFS transporter [Streptomyces rapamycinicus]AGP60255.1 hypothetical protein M271_44435 [Streptomyces rapamycinicus NRRL 5491]MBB4788582.1 MFS family permease [Streptomyces rapamycinicus]RLV72913.1 hypothetical protein D3C57_150340 [Streptomyces rapamycinicus NRRL 5491]UTP35838.1 MFS transporter [Streptomyces rapamycinicus NRRL 5491]
MDGHRSAAPYGVPDELDAGRLEHRSTAFCVFVLIVLVLIGEMIAFEFTFVYPALTELAALYKTPDIGWVLTIASLVGASVTATVGKLSDMYGKRLVIAWMLGAFAIGTLLCATTSSFGVLLLGRVLQGAAIPISAVSYGLVRDIMPRRLVPIGLGMLASGVGASGVLGPLLGGALIDWAGVRSIFWFLLVYVIVVGAVLLAVVPESPVRAPQRLDLGGAITLFTSVALILLAVSKGEEWGWSSGRTLASLAGGVLVMGVFFQVQRRVTEPLMHLGLLTRRSVATTLLVALLGQFPLAAYSFLNPLMQQSPPHPGNDHGLGLSAFRLGVEITVFQGGMAVIFGVVGGRLARRCGGRVVAIAGCSALTVGILSLGYAGTTLWELQLVAAVTGVGFGMYYAAIPNLMVEAVHAKEQGIAAGMQGVVAGSAASAATAALGAILARHVLVNDPATGVVIYQTDGFRYACFAAALVGAGSVVAAVSMRHGRAPATGGAAPDADPERAAPAGTAPPAPSAT